MELSYDAKVRKWIGDQLQPGVHRISQYVKKENREAFIEVVKGMIRENALWPYYTLDFNSSYTKFRKLKWDHDVD